MLTLGLVATCLACLTQQQLVWMACPGRPTGLLPWPAGLLALVLDWPLLACLARGLNRVPALGCVAC